MRALLFAVLLAVAMAPVVAQAQEAEPTPAERQIELAREDFAKGDFTRAIQACESALRLDSGMKEAFKIKGLALEQLGEREDARAMLKAYQTLNSGLPDDPDVTAALERLDAPSLHPMPVVLLGAGSALAVAGFVMHGTAYEAGKEFMETPQPLARQGDYQSLYDRNVGGLALGIAGAAMAGAGAGLLVATLVGGPDVLAATPVFGVGPGGVSVGVVGRW